MRHLKILAPLIVAVTVLMAAGPGSASAAAPFRATALWVSQVPAQDTPGTLAARAIADGVHALYVKAGNSSTPDPQFTPALVAGLKADGISVCAWTFAYGADPRGEAAVAIGAVRDGAQCLVVDAEGQYDGRYGAAQLFVRDVRAAVGRQFPIGLAGQAEVAEHQTFPYSVFLGPGGFTFNLPQIYWKDLGISPDRAFLATVGGNAIYRRPIVPVGQLYGSPSTAAVSRFRSLAVAYGCAGLSFFSLDAAAPAGLSALLGPVQPIGPRTAVLPTLRPGADGDQVVWAQELLNADGAGLPVGGFYGARTGLAVGAFQTQHRLAPTGIIGPSTWRFLLRLSAQEPSWSKAPPESARPAQRSAE